MKFRGIFFVDRTKPWNYKFPTLFLPIEICIFCFWKHSKKSKEEASWKWWLPVVFNIKGQWNVSQCNLGSGIKLFTFRIPSQPNSIVDFDPIRILMTRSYWRSRFWYNFDQFRSISICFWLIHPFLIIFQLKYPKDHFCVDYLIKNGLIQSKMVEFNWKCLNLIENGWIQSKMSSNLIKNPVVSDHFQSILIYFQSNSNSESNFMSEFVSYRCNE